MTTAHRVAAGRVMKDNNKMAYDRNAGRVQSSISSRVRQTAERLRRLTGDPVPPPPKPLRFHGRFVAAQAKSFAIGELTLGPRDRLLIHGPNGSGKSTLRWWKNWSRRSASIRARWSWSVTTGRCAAGSGENRRECTNLPEIRTTIEAPGAPYGVTVDKAGALWFTMAARGAIGRWTGEQVETIALDPADGQPTVIVAGHDDAVWFTEFRGNRIGRIGADGALSFVSAGAPYGLCTGPDGALWFTELRPGGLGRLSVDGTIARYPVDGMPSMITAGPDGALWFTLNQADAIGRVTADGAVTTYALPTEQANPVGITAGPDGALWLVEIGAGQVGRVSVDGAIEEFPLPDRAARPHAIIAGPDGALWFTQWGSSRLGRITTAGQISELDLPGAEPHGLALGPDGAIWIAMESGSLVCVEPDGRE